MVRNVEAWGALMAGETFEIDRATDVSMTELLDRLDAAADRLARVARRVRDHDAWDETWTDTLDDPPREKPFGTAIAHVITHSMHHRAQVIAMLRRLGVEGVPEGDVFSWEKGT